MLLGVRVNDQVRYLGESNRFITKGKVYEVIEINGSLFQPSSIIINDEEGTPYYVESSEFNNYIKYSVPDLHSDLSEDELLALADVALDSGDKEWFNQITSKIVSMKVPSDEVYKSDVPYVTSHLTKEAMEIQYRMTYRESED